MKKLILTLGTGLLCSFLSYSQNEVDALRYSNITYGGTARFVSMGGAFGALGADFSNLSINPAGIAIYKKTELSFTPVIFTQSTKSDYNGTLSSDGKSNFNIGNVGLVASHVRQAIDDKDTQGWMNTNFAIGYNRINNFHNRVSIFGNNIYGNNMRSSFLDLLVDNSRNTSVDDLDPFAGKLAFDTWLIDTIAGDPYNYSSAIPAGSGLTQRKSIETSGSMGETVISFGGNYSNKLYLGATFGIDNIRYSEESSYEELDKNDSISSFDSYTYNSKVSTSGVGFNFKFGMIYRVSEWFRFGGAIHSPTFFSMTDDYNNTMSSSYNHGADEFNSESPQGTFDYDLTTPMKAIGSIAVTIPGKGLLSADYEFVDYSSAILSSSPNVFFDANDNIRGKYTSTGNLRIGTEWRADPFSFRAGYSLYGNPYKTQTGNSASRSSYSIGLGIREQEYFIDFAYVLSQSSENHYLYDPSITNAVKNKLQGSAFMMTLGFRY